MWTVNVTTNYTDGSEETVESLEFDCLASVMDYLAHSWNYSKLRVSSYVVTMVAPK